MPTRSNPDSPFPGAQLEAALGGRLPGTPSTAGKPTPQAANFNFPAPPAPAAAPVGRPPAPSMPAPMAPSAPAPSAPTPSAAGPTGAPAETRTGVGTAEAGPAAAAAPVVDTQRYREAVIQVRTRLGPVPRVFRHPSLPEMPAEPGVPNFNPFTGMWSD